MHVFARLWFQLGCCSNVSIIYPIFVYICISIEKGSLDIWINGLKVDTRGEFVEDGTEIHFDLDDKDIYIKTKSSGNVKEGLLYELIVNDQVVPEVEFF